MTTRPPPGPTPIPTEEELRELRAHSSRRRYGVFRRAFRSRRYHQLSSHPGTWRPEPQAALGREKTVRQRRFLHDYRQWLKPYMGTVIWLLVLSLVAAALEMAHPLFLRFIVDQALLGSGPTSPASRLRLLNLAGGIFLAVIFVGQLIGLWKNYTQRLLNTRVILSLRRAMYERMLHLPLHRLWDMKTGGVISRLTGDVSTTTGFLQMAIISPGVSLIRLLLALGILFYINWRLALTAITVTPFVMAASFLVARRVRPIYRAIREDNSEVDSRISETFGGVRVVRAFQREQRELANYMVGNNTIVRKELFAHRRELILWTGWGLLMALINLVIVWYGGRLFVSNRASIGDIMAFQWYTLLLLNPVWQIVNSFSELQRSMAAMERVFDVLAMARDKPDAPDAIEAPQQVNRLEFVEVGFEYEPGQPVLQDFSVDVPGGSVVALVGRSGAGKTTVTDLVARFHDPTRGQILVNGIDIRQLQLRSYRQLLGVVQQEVFLFDGTIAENIAYGRPEATQEKIVDAAIRANAHEFIAPLPHGYDSLIGERGVKLSGGQRQRLSIARAILADPQILILDEATSNLDSESEQLIQQSLEDLLRGRTTFLIAHRLSTVTHADLILVLEDGRIVERGRHEELLRQQGLYAEMVARQMDSVDAS